MKITKAYNLMELRAARRLANQIPNVSFFNTTRLINNVGTKKIEHFWQQSKMRQAINSKIDSIPALQTSFLDPSIGRHELQYLHFTKEITTGNIFAAQ